MFEIKLVASHVSKTTNEHNIQFIISVRQVIWITCCKILVESPGLIQLQTKFWVGLWLGKITSGGSNKWLKNSWKSADKKWLLDSYKGCVAKAGCFLLLLF